MQPAPPPPRPSVPGVLGLDGRYPLRERPAPPLRIAGRTMLVVGPTRVYACGITPYDVTHVGHASTFVWADLVASLAHATGGDAVVVRNVTDVDDVLTRAARERGRNYDELALTQEFHFDRDMTALGVARPAQSPHARGHVASVQRLAAALLEAGAAYEAEGHVWFDGAAVPEHTGLDPDAALTASTEYGDQADTAGRRHVFDVAVWRPSGADDPAWPSPWGWGRPGWHAECAAMALCAHGSAVDVLVGGVDLTFPHHAYQAAMVEAATGVTPFARTVLHVGEVRLGGRKMAKSTGNLVLVDDLLERYPGTVLRLALLDRAWDQPWECEESVFTRAAERLARLRESAAAAPAGADVDADAWQAVLTRLATELDVPGALRAAEDADPAVLAHLLQVLRLTAG